MNRKTKKTTNRSARKTSVTWWKKILPVSPTMFFRTVILLCTLLVATIAILNNAYESNVWTFLGSMIVYAALTRGQDARQ